MIIIPSTLNQLEPKHRRYTKACEAKPGFTVKVNPTGLLSFYHRVKVEGQYQDTYLGNDYESSLGKYEALREAPPKRRPAPVHESLPFADNGYLFLGDMTWANLCRLWLETHIRPERSPNTYLGYAAILRAFDSSTGGYPENITLHAARQVLKDYIFDKARSGYPVAANRIKSCMGSLFKWGMLHDYVRDTPVYSMPSWKENPKARRYTDAELRALLPYLEDSEMTLEKKRIIKLILLTGLRISEVFAAEVSNLDGQRLIIDSTKNGSPHLVALPQVAVDLLRLQQEAAAGRKVFFRGNAWGIRQALQRASKSVSVTPCSAHDLRRTCATMCGQLGVSVEVIERILNHSALSVTRKHYALYDMEAEKRDALERVAEHLIGLGLTIS